MTPRLTDPRTQALLSAPLMPLLLRLSVPNMAVMLAQSSVGLIETYFVGKLGTDALAGVALVFPLLMLMAMMSAGAMGGGISSAIARALGAGRREDADALALHAVLIALCFGIMFSVVVLAGGPAIYRLMGGREGSLAAATTYSSIVFGAAVLVWLFNSLAAVVRGTGNMATPALVSIVGAVLLVGLSPCLIFGVGPLPRLGVAGGAVAVVLYYAAGSLYLAAYLRLGRSVVRLRLVPIQARLLWDILRVGAVAALVTLQTNLTVALTTGLAGSFGPAAIAGYGTGSRLEYLLVPLVFGLGGPLVAIVGTNIGAGNRARALRTAWLGAAMAAFIAEAIGLAAATWPLAWLTLFGHDPGMLDAGARYLRMVGPFYGFFGLGMALYFASQGAGRLWWPLGAGVLRLVVAVCGGWIALAMTGNLSMVFLALGFALVLFGLVNAAAVAAGTWFPAVLLPAAPALNPRRGVP